jgi:hypothetical protein
MGFAQVANSRNRAKTATTALMKVKLLQKVTMTPIVIPK